MKIGIYRAAAVCTALIIGLSLTACQPQPKPPATSEPPLDAYRVQYQDLPLFRALDEAQQQNYDALFTAVTEQWEVDTVIKNGASSGEESLSLRVELPQELSDGDEVAALFYAFINDNPQFFYIGNTYTYEGYKVGGRAHYNVLYLTLTMNAAERRVAAAQMEEALDVILAGLGGKDAAFRELALHDRLIARCQYDEEAAASDAPDKEYPFAFTAFGALVNGKAVCEGYARAFQLLCRRADIACVTVNGVDLANGTAHMWNLVTLGDASYHVDVTWDDQLDTALHVYYNLTTEEIARTHRLDTDSAGQDCTDANGGYYRATGRYQEKYDREAIAAAVAKEIQNGATVVELQFSADKLPSITLFVKNHTWFSESVNAYLPQGLAMWEYAYYTYSPYGVLVLSRETA